MTKAVEAVSRVLTGDLVVFRGKVHRKREQVFYGPDLTPTGRPRKHTQELLEPVDVELHVNPVTVGLGALTLGVGLAGLALAAWWSGIGVRLDSEVEARLRDVNILIRVGETRIQELEGQLTLVYGSVAAAPPDDPLAQELASVKEQFAKFKKERSRLRRGLLKLETRPRFGENLFRIF